MKLFALVFALLMVTPPTIPGDDVPVPEVPHDEDFSRVHTCG